MRREMLRLRLIRTPSISNICLHRLRLHFHLPRKLFLRLILLREVSDKYEPFSVLQHEPNTKGYCESVPIMFLLIRSNLLGRGHSLFPSSLRPKTPTLISDMFITGIRTPVLS